MSLGTWIAIIIVSVLIAIIVGLILGFFITKKVFEKQLRENPPINEKQIRAMYLQMGRKPTETQVRQTMQAIKNAK